MHVQVAPVRRKRRQPYSDYQPVGFRTAKRVYQLDRAVIRLLGRIQFVKGRVEGLLGLPTPSEDETEDCVDFASRLERLRRVLGVVRAAMGEEAPQLCCAA